jgi:glutathione synthase/RimK-type ligase-like ATP-grasp enzyme
MIVPKKLTNKNSHSIQMSSQLFTHLQLKNTKDVNISVGQITITTKVQTIEISGNEIYLPENILKAFCLPLQAITFQAMYWAETHTLKLGPVIGLLTDFPEIENEEPHFRSIHLFCEELHRGITAHGGFFYVFSYDKFTNQGFYLENGKWISAQLPLPDVIYNRIHSRMLEHKKQFKQFRRELEQLMIPFFNDRFLSKWEVYEQLKSENQLNAYIPETKLFSKEHFHEFTQKYNNIFLKPIHGSQGRNIIKVMKEQGNLYSFQTSLPALPDNFEKKYSVDELYQQIKPLLRNGIYIIQQGIDLVSHDSCAMDFRILCHKDINNQWVVTSTVARIAAEQAFVSNLARGGTLTRPLNALRTCMSHKKSIEALLLMKELALETASVISKHSGGIMGELGIDIGVDLKGKPWLIEVNSKPSKKFEDGLGKIRPSTKAIIQFCTKLAFD